MIFEQFSAFLIHFCQIPALFLKTFFFIFSANFQLFFVIFAQFTTFLTHFYRIFTELPITFNILFLYFCSIFNYISWFFINFMHFLQISFEFLPNFRWFLTKFKSRETSWKTRKNILTLRYLGAGSRFWYWIFDFWFPVFDQKLATKDNYEWFLHIYVKMLFWKKSKMKKWKSFWKIEIMND